MYLLFLFCQKLRPSLRKDQYRGPQKGWAQAQAPDTGTEAWKKRLMPSGRLCLAKCSLLYPGSGVGGRLCEELPGLHGWDLVGRGRILHQRWLLKGLALLFLLLLELQEFKCRDLGLTNCLSQLSTDLVG